MTTGHIGGGEKNRMFYSKRPKTYTTREWEVQLEIICL